MSKERFQLGPFWLGQRNDSPVWYIEWNEPGAKGKRGRTQRHTTGERDFSRAQERLAEHFLEHATLRDEKPQNVTIAFVLDRYYEKRGKKLASCDTVKSAIAKWKAFWGDATVDELRSEARQREFVAFLTQQPAENSRNEFLAPSTIRRQLNVGRTALSRAHKRHEITAMPHVMTLHEYTDGEDSGDRNRERTLSLEEMAALFNAAARTEHLWRYMILMVGSCGRPGVPLDIGISQIDLARQRLKLLPPGRKQTKKRRPIIPVCATLLPLLRVWCAKDNRIYRGERGRIAIVDRLVTWHGKPLKGIRDGFNLLKERAGIVDPEVVPYSIRHTMTTWLAEKDVPDRELEIFVGHREPGNETTNRYIHLKPGYLRKATAAVDAYFSELTPLLNRPLRASCTPVEDSRLNRDSA